MSALPWYMWVWGGATTASMLVWLCVGVVAIVEMFIKRRDRKRGWLNEIASLERTNDRLLGDVKKLKVELRELSKGSNEYGSISP